MEKAASSDAEIRVLFDKIRLDDPQAFKEFFYEHFSEIYRFLYRYTNQRETAEDLAQETFVRFWQARMRIDPSLSPRGYIFRIARNLAMNYLERERVPSVSIDLRDDILVTLMHDPEEAYFRSFLMDDFQKALSFLPERCRAVFILSRYHELHYDEISAVLEISVQTVKNQMNKAISVLRQRLSHHLE